MSPKLTLYGTTISPPVRAVLLTLNELGLDYEFKHVSVLTGDTKTPEYLKLNPQHTVPTLVDDDKTIWDSHAIIAYLARKYGKDDSLYPEDYYKRAVVDQRMYYESTVMFAKHLRSIFGAILRKNAKLEDLKEELSEVQETWDLLEKFLAEHQYMADDKMTIADLSILSTASSLQMITSFDEATHPKLTTWFARMQKLPYYEKANGEGIKKGLELLKSKSQA